MIVIQMDELLISVVAILVTIALNWLYNYTSGLKQRLVEANKMVDTQKKSIDEMMAAFSSMLTMHMPPLAPIASQQARSNPGPVPPACPARRVRLADPVVASTTTPQTQKETTPKKIEDTDDAYSEDDHTPPDYNAYLERAAAEHRVTQPPPSPRFECTCARPF